jgi:hypothetical protein
VQSRNGCGLWPGTGTCQVVRSFIGPKLHVPSLAASDSDRTSVRRRSRGLSMRCANHCERSFASFASRGVRSDHAVEEARSRGWDALGNGELLDAAEADGFDVSVTTDRNIRHQQNLTCRRIAVVVGKGPMEADKEAASGDCRGCCCGDAGLSLPKSLSGRAASIGPNSGWRLAVRCNGGGITPTRNLEVRCRPV